MRRDFSFQTGEGGCLHKGFVYKGKKWIFGEQEIVRWENQMRPQEFTSHITDFVLVSSFSNVLPFFLPQGFCQAPAATNSNEGAAEKLCCLLEATQLAVVETVYQGTDYEKDSVGGT